MNIERKFIDLADFKQSEAGAGGFGGYASVFGDLDSVGDIVLPGAYAETASAFITEGWLAADHTWGVKDDLGVITQAFEDGHGLKVEAEFHPTADAQEVREKIINRLSKGKSVKLSIGYVPLDAEIVSGKEAAKYLRDQSPANIKAVEAVPQVRLLKKIKLFEVSLVSVPALHSASVATAKALASETDSESEGPHAGLTFKEHSETALAAMKEFITRATSLTELRLKEGRVLSTANRQRLSQMLESLESLKTEIAGLLETTEPKAEDQKADPATIAKLLAEIEFQNFTAQQAQN